MGKTTGISWTDHTFNPWWGCVEVSPACDNCYAREFARRMGFNASGKKGPELWGKDAPRRFFGDKHWAEPLHWNRQAEADGVRRKVFCASMADWSEDRRDLDEPRQRLYSLVEETTSLDWLLLTKRDGEFLELLPDRWIFDPPPNAWVGVTVENQRMADIRLPMLRQFTKNPMPWVSYEPALGPVDWTPWLDFLRWIIFGGESGSDRESRAEWALNTMEQCRRRGQFPDGRPAVALFNKQSGEFMARQWRLTDKAGKDPSEWPEWFRVQQFPDQVAA